MTLLRKTRSSCPGSPHLDQRGGYHARLHGLTPRFRKTARREEGLFDHFRQIAGAQDLPTEQPCLTTVRTSGEAS